MTVLLVVIEPSIRSSDRTFMFFGTRYIVVEISFTGDCLVSFAGQ
jgi:hypothetical protein